MIGNMAIKVTGDTASSRTICFNPMEVDLEANQRQVMFLGLWYVDKFVRTPKGWRISDARRGSVLRAQRSGRHQGHRRLKLQINRLKSQPSSKRVRTTGTRNGDSPSGVKRLLATPFDKYKKWQTRECLAGSNKPTSNSRISVIARWSCPAKYFGQILYLL